jgi:DNA-directed RNA polymerase specialized sigma24 family protein
MKRYRFSEQDAQDIASETLLLIRKRSEQFDPLRGSFLVWRNVIAGGLCLTVLRSRRRLTPMDFEPDSVLPGCLQTSQATQKRVDDLLAVLRVIEQLPEKQREAMRVLLKAEISGRDLPELTQPTFASRLHEARKKLRAWLRSEFKGGPKPPKGDGASGPGHEPKRKLKGKALKKLEAARQFFSADLLRTLNLESRDTDELSLLLEALNMQRRIARRPLWGSLDWWRASSKAPVFFVAGLAAVSAVFVIGGIAFRMMYLPHEKAPAMRAILHDHHRSIGIGPGGAITGLETLPNPYRENLQQVLIARRIERPDILRDLSEADNGSASSNGSEPRDATSTSSGSKKPSETGGEPAGPLQERSGVRMLGPMGIVVETPNPIFRWQGSRAARYMVSVYDERYNQIAQSEWLPGAQQWSVPSALRRGARYSWRLSVRQNGRTLVVLPLSSEARFRVLGTAEERQLSVLRGSPEDSHLLLGVSYAQMGLLEQAEEQLRELQKENPESEVGASLLQSVLNLYGPNRPLPISRPLRQMPGR